MASRFFYGSDSESSSSGEEEDVYDHSGEEDSEAEDSSDESSGSDSDESDSDDGKTGINKFLRDASESEESEDEEKVTVVKSAKDKRLEGLENTIKLIENAQKIGDWSVISTGECSLSPTDLLFQGDIGFAGEDCFAIWSWRLTVGFLRVRQP